MSALDQSIATLQAKVAAEETVVDSAVTFINGVSKMIADAVAKALAAGATAAELQSLTDLGTSLDAKAASLSAAITANTPTT